MSTSPKPGKPVRGSTSGRPLMAALDLLGKRWTLRIIWELRSGAVGFRELAQRCDGISTAVLRERLIELIEAAVVTQDAERKYLLTNLGPPLISALEPLDGWARKWERHVRAD